MFEKLEQSYFPHLNAMEGTDPWHSVELYNNVLSDVGEDLEYLFEKSKIENSNWPVYEFSLISSSSPTPASTPIAAKLKQTLFTDSLNENNDRLPPIDWLNPQRLLKHLETVEKLKLSKPLPPLPVPSALLLGLNEKEISSLERSVSMTHYSSITGSPLSNYSTPNILRYQRTVRSREPVESSSLLLNVLKEKTASRAQHVDALLDHCWKYCVAVTGGSIDANDQVVGLSESSMGVLSAIRQLLVNFQLSAQELIEGLQSTDALGSQQDAIESLKQIDPVAMISPPWQNILSELIGFQLLQLEDKSLELDYVYFNRSATSRSSNNSSSLPFKTHQRKRRLSTDSFDTGDGNTSYNHNHSYTYTNNTNDISKFISIGSPYTDDYSYEHDKHPSKSLRMEVD